MIEILLILFVIYFFLSSFFFCLLYVSYGLRGWSIKDYYLNNKGLTFLSVYAKMGFLFIGFLLFSIFDLFYNLTKGE